MLKGRDRLSLCRRRSFTRQAIETLDWSLSTSLVPFFLALFFILAWRILEQLFVSSSVMFWSFPIEWKLQWLLHCKDNWTQKKTFLVSDPRIKWSTQIKWGGKNKKWNWVILSYQQRHYWIVQRGKVDRSKFNSNFPEKVQSPCEWA